jgi:hypothetical protein
MLKEHKYNSKERLCDKSKLAPHAFEEGHRIAWDQTETLKIESKPIFRKNKQLHIRVFPTIPLAKPVWRCLLYHFLYIIPKELKFI